MPEDKKAKRDEYRKYASHKRKQGTKPLSREQFEKYGRYTTKGDAENYEKQLAFQQKARKKTGYQEGSKGTYLTKQDPKKRTTGAGTEKRPKRSKEVGYQIGSEPREKRTYVEKDVEMTPGLKRDYYGVAKERQTGGYDLPGKEEYRVIEDREGKIVEEKKTRTKMQPKSEKVTDAVSRSRGDLEGTSAARQPLFKRKFVEKSVTPERKATTDTKAGKRLAKRKAKAEVKGEKLVRPGGGRARDVRKYLVGTKGEIGYNPLKRQLAEQKARAKKAEETGKVAEAKQRGKKIIYKEKTDYAKIREENKAARERRKLAEEKAKDKSKSKKSKRRYSFPKQSKMYGS